MTLASDSFKRVRTGTEIETISREHKISAATYNKKRVRQDPDHQENTESKSWARRREDR